MKLHPRVTKAAVELVKRFEGLRRKAARLPDGGWTIGYGHTATARDGAQVSEEEAELLLFYDLSEVATRVEAWTFTPLNQNQFEALIAFAFNIGPENFRRSTVLKRVNEGQFLQAAAAMELWRKTEVDGDSVVVDALVRRRAAEKAHFLTPPEGFKPSPSQIVKPAFDFSVIEAAAQSQAADRTAEVEAPLEGGPAAAHIERSAAVEPPRESVAEAQAPSVLRDADAAPPVDLEPLNRAESQSGETPTAAPTFQSHETQADGLAVPPAPDAPSRPFSFAGFEPPPPRVSRSFEWPGETTVDAPPPFQPERTDPELSARADEMAASLFDGPVRHPLPNVEDLPVERVIRSARDAAPAPREGVNLLLRNAAVLFGSLGCLGVLLFALTVTSMLTGRASVAHLLIGLVGVVLMTVAGIYFLMKRGEPPVLEEIPVRRDAALPE